MANDLNLSKHVQTILVSLATMAIGYLAYSVQENNVRLAVLVEKVDRLEHRAYADSTPLSFPIQLPDPPTTPMLPVHALPASFDKLELRRR